ncbi:hypothetical protein P154DRAFT_532817 [Amniculicola lignicola CBS 123094]|uniref:Uncharacterized protein n=1 Tax=Amniculicola lignicola CBS 123094 TaxID=1392246 RepID=A0A6A5WM36_9PLEO|nr:hypothetical protein P154DRAFT_532817 [Amniculicola lignicola CBS 123094]
MHCGKVLVICGGYGHEILRPGPLRDVEIRACKEARQVLDDLRFLENNSNNGNGPDPSTDKPGRERWIRILDAFVVLFGTPFDSNGNIIQDSTGTMIYVKGLFTKMVLRCSFRDDGRASSQTMHLYCGDPHFRFINNDEVDPESPDTTVGVNYPDQHEVDKKGKTVFKVGVIFDGVEKKWVKTKKDTEKVYD